MSRYEASATPPTCGDASTSGRTRSGDAGERLLLEHVERRAGVPPLLQATQERGLAVESTARRTHERRGMSPFSPLEVGPRSREIVAPRADRPLAPNGRGPRHRAQTPVHRGVGRLRRARCEVPPLQDEFFRRRRPSGQGKRPAVEADGHLHDCIDEEPWGVPSNTERRSGVHSR
jgi:hypothetical protein